MDGATPTGGNNTPRPTRSKSGPSPTPAGHCCVLPSHIRSHARSSPCCRCRCVSMTCLNAVGRPGRACAYTPCLPPCIAGCSGYTMNSASLQRLILRARLCIHAASRGSSTASLQAAPSSLCRPLLLLPPRVNSRTLNTQGLGCALGCTQLVSSGGHWSGLLVSGDYAALFALIWASSSSSSSL